MALRVLLMLTALGFSQLALADKPPHETPETRQRAKEGMKRLKKLDIGEYVIDGIKAHGGLRDWYGSGALTFTYDYNPVGEGIRRVSTQTIDLMDSRAYHTVKQPVQGEMAWDGEEAWATFESSRQMPVRFWALTPYYFVALPFVCADPGVNLTYHMDDSMAMELERSRVVKMTFDSGVGDAPDDYYILYFSEKTERLIGIRYIVTYKPFFEGREVSQTEEKIIVLSDYKEVGPLTIATRHETYKIIAGMRTEKVTDSRITDLEYGVKFDESRLEKPEGAIVDTSMDSFE